MSESTPSTGAPSAAPSADTSANTTLQTPSQLGAQATPEQAAALASQLENGTPKQQAVAKKMLREIKYKADGQEFTEQLGFDVPEDQVEYMQKQLSLTKGAQKRMAQYGQLENEVKQFVSSMKTDTKTALARMGIDPKQFAAQMLEEEIKLNSMTPEQREREELKAELQRIKQEQSKEKEEFSKKELERVTQLEYDRISTKIEKAIDSSGLPKEPAIVKRIANYMLIGNQMNIKLDPEELTEIVRDDMYREIQGLVKSLGADKVEQLVGKDILKQIRQKNVAKAKATGATAKAGIKDVTSSAKKDEKPVEKKTFKQHFGF